MKILQCKTIQSECKTSFDIALNSCLIDCGEEYIKSIDFKSLSVAVFNSVYPVNIYIAHILYYDINEEGE